MYKIVITFMLAISACGSPVRNSKQPEIEYNISPKTAEPSGLFTCPDSLILRSLPPWKLVEQCDDEGLIFRCEVDKDLVPLPCEFSGYKCKDSSSLGDNVPICYWATAICVEECPEGTER